MLISKSMALISCQIAHSSKVLMPWSIIFDFSTSCTFTELYNSIKNGQSAPDGCTFPEKYDKCSVSTTIGRSKVENDSVVMSCNVAQAVAAFGKYISFKLFDNIKQIILDRGHNSCSSGFDEIFRKKEENFWKKKASLPHPFFFTKLA